MTGGHSRDQVLPEYMMIAHNSKHLYLDELTLTVIKTMRFRYKHLI